MGQIILHSYRFYIAKDDFSNGEFIALLYSLNRKQMKK